MASSATPAARSCSLRPDLLVGPSHNSLERSRATRSSTSAKRKETLPPPMPGAVKSLRTTMRIQFCRPGEGMSRFPLRPASLVRRRAFTLEESGEWVWAGRSPPPPSSPPPPPFICPCVSSKLVRRHRCRRRSFVIVRWPLRATDVGVRRRSRPSLPTLIPSFRGRVRSSFPTARPFFAFPFSSRDPRPPPPLPRRRLRLLPSAPPS